MFHDIPEAVESRMRELEALDAEQRRQGLPAIERLCSITPDTGKFLALLAVSAPPGAFVEVGTSGGYSTLWLALACARRGHALTTIELREHKAALARETFKAAGVESYVDLVLGDAREHLPRYKNVSFCFLDCVDDEYLDCYEKILPNMVSGGLIVADNAVNHAEAWEPFLRRAPADARVDGLGVPIGKGGMGCRKL